MIQARTAVRHRRLAAEETLLPEGIPPGRRGVLIAALRLFAEHGYGGTSVRDIGKQAGIQAATLYSHYPSKEHVLAELIRIGHEEHQRALRTELLESGSDPREQLSALMRAHVRMHCAFPMLAVVANAELHALSPEFAAPSLQLRQQSEQLLMDVVQRGIKLGVFDTPDPWLAMAAIGAMGIRVAHWYTPASGKSPEEVAEVYAELARRIVGARATPAVKKGEDPHK